MRWAMVTGKLGRITAGLLGGGQYTPRAGFFRT